MIFNVLAFKANDRGVENIIAGPETIGAYDENYAKIKFCMNMEKEWGVAFDSDTMGVIAVPFRS